MRNLVKLYPWDLAAHLVSRWMEHRDRIDVILEGIPSDLTGAERARCQRLIIGVVRHAARIEAALSARLAHRPRPLTLAALQIASLELLEEADGDREEGRPARIVHHAVERTRLLSSPAEAGLANAVLRQVAEAFAAEKEPGRLVSAAELARYYSHPEWLVLRWLAAFGADSTRALLRWNQSTAPVYARLRRPAAPNDSAAAAARLPALPGRPARWSGFVEIDSSEWPAVMAGIASGQLYLQDPGSSLAVLLLDPKAGETVLDLCAAPGGKSLQIADRMGTGRLVACDLPGERIRRLKENLARIVPGGVDAALVEADLFGSGLADSLRSLGLPGAFDAVLVDVPCSNTGVMRHRVDVKWRLQEGDFGRHARQQVRLLIAAARFVAPGGRLVYSTCSIDPEENESVLKAFLSRPTGFRLDGTSSTRPWEAGHDGAAAFLLRREG